MKHLYLGVVRGHGSPLFALEPGAAGGALADLATTLERPSAVLEISPHWETEVPAVGTASQLETIHDFGGFDPALYDIQHPASGGPESCVGAMRLSEASRLGGSSSREQKSGKAG
ncbi:MAG: hypothetical protein VKM34_08165 [Cyanobacteriota bacterium]|nr:hypothetical protein [Cyanobacteriota bacterium]